MSRSRFAAVAGLAVLATAALAACSPGGGGQPAQDADAPITVWVDDTRTAQAEAWVEAHPDVDVTVETIDNTQGAVSQKVSLALKAGSDIPDAVFLSTPDEISNLVTNQVPYAMPLNGVVDQEVLDGFADGSIERCTFDGKAYCLPNDIAQTVLYYNKTLFDQFGYAVPATMTEFAALGERVAAEQPGYSLGTVNARYGLDGFFGSSECPLTESSSPTEVRIDSSAPECTRVLETISPMLQNGTLSTLDFFDAAYAPVIAEGKLLAAVAPSWMGEYGIKPNYTTEGDFAVAPTPAWDESAGSVAGAVGGGVWLGYAETANSGLVAEFLTDMTTDVALAETASTYPADTAMADAWLERLSGDAWYAEDPSTVLREAAGSISPSLGYVRYQTQLLDIYGSTIISNATGDLTGPLEELGAKATSAAESSGYTVSK